MSHELRRLVLALEQETAKVTLALPQRVAMETTMEGGYTTIDGSGLRSVVRSIRETYDEMECKP